MDTIDKMLTAQHSTAQLTAFIEITFKRHKEKVLSDFG